MSFDNMNLNNALRNALEDLDIVTATPIQQQSFSAIMSGKDLVGIAKTGTGKTFAYLLPVIRQLKFSKQKHASVLILVPTRELVEQVVKEAEKLSKYISLRINGVYGGVNINTQSAFLDKTGSDIIIATPGRLIDLALNRVVKLKVVRQIIIDEVDEMFNLGFLPQLKQIFDLLPERRQNILFSATLNAEMEKFINTFFLEPMKIEISASGSTADGIDQFLYKVPNFETKINLLLHLISKNEMHKILIFSPTKKIADLIFEYIEQHSPGKAGIIHSNKSQNYRLRTVENFQNGNHMILISTDLIARGLDFDNISHVINFDTPEESENYIHRIGRTARAGKKGTAITFVNEIEVTKELNYLDSIESLIDKKIVELAFPFDVEISDNIHDHEKIIFNQKNAAKNIDHTRESKGAFHEKKLKNTKVNQAQEKRIARKIEKKKAKRKKK